MGGQEQRSFAVAQNRFHLLQLLPEIEELLVLGKSVKADSLGFSFRLELGCALNFLGGLRHLHDPGIGFGSDFLGAFFALVAVMGGFQIALTNNAAEDGVTDLGGVIKPFESNVNDVDAVF